VYRAPRAHPTWHGRRASLGPTKSSPRELASAEGDWAAGPINSSQRKIDRERLAVQRSAKRLRLELLGSTPVAL